MKIDFSRFPVEKKIYNWLSITLFGIITIVIILTFRDYGIAWDEEFQHPYGKYVLAYFTSFFSDKRVLTFENLYLYGGLFDLIVATTIKVTGFSNEYDVRHFLNAMCGLVSIIGTWKLGSLLRKEPAGFWSAIFLTLCPVYYGHMFNNPKDIPFAAGYVWSVYLITIAIASFPKLPKSLILKLGLAIGWTMGVRVGGLLLLCYLPLAALDSWVLIFTGQNSNRHSTKNLPSFGQFLLSISKSILMVSILAYVIMLLAWPWAQLNPIVRPFAALEELSHFKFLGLVLFNGTEHLPDQLPYSYIPKLLFIQTPEIILILLFAGIILSILFFINTKERNNNKSNQTEQTQDATPYQLGFIVFATVFPVAYVIFKKAALYDSFRHFLFIVPLICCMAGFAISSILDRAKKSRFFSAGILGLAGLSLVYSLSISVQYHPYQYVYFNNFIGGLQGAAGRYNLDYWGVALTEAIKEMLAAIKRDPIPNKKQYKVFICGPSVSAKAFFPPEVSITENSSEADFFLSVTRRNCHNRIPGTPIIVIERFGVPFAVVKDRRYPDGYPPLKY